MVCDLPERRQTWMPSPAAAAGLRLQGCGCGCSAAQLSCCGGVRCQRVAQLLRTSHALQHDDRVRGRTSKPLKVTARMRPCWTAMQMSTQCTAHFKPSNCSMPSQAKSTTGHTSGEVAADKATAQRACRLRSAQSGSSTSLAAAAGSCVRRTHPSPPPANLPADHGCCGRTQLE
jgi:hypothetical protein